MIRLERAGAEDLETIIAIQRASFKAVYDKYQDEYDPYLEDRERIKWKLVERPNSYYYFVKEDEEKIGFLRIHTNEELTRCALERTFVSFTTTTWQLPHVGTRDIILVIT